MSTESNDFYSRICDFERLYRAHRKARLGKRNTKEVILFENNLGENLSILSERLSSDAYQIGGYYSFTVKDPKERQIYALHYQDRVIQHCICDEALSVILEPKLIYDNSACRVGKGTHFSMGRLTGFLTEHYRQSGADGYFLRFDIRKFFDSVDHNVLKKRLNKVIKDKRLFNLLNMFIDSYHTGDRPGKGIPPGNQTSQWFALYYLDGLDRLIKEKLHIRHYTRYMDDGVIIHRDKDYLKYCLSEM